MSYFRFLKMEFPIAILGAAAGAFVSQGSAIIAATLLIVGVISFAIAISEMKEVVQLADNKIKVTP